MAKWHSLLLLALQSALSISLYAQEAAPSPYEQLISELAGAEYEEREAAAARILEIGEPIRPWIEKAIKGRSLEARLRSVQLLKQIDQSAYAKRISRFRQSGVSSAEPGLPCWEEFRQLFGNGDDARDLFADVASNQPAYLALYSDFRKASAALGNQIAGEQRQALLNLKSRPLKEALRTIALDSISNDRKLNIETLAISMLIASDMELRDQKAISSAALGFFRDPMSLAALKKNRHFHVMRKGAAKWLEGSEAKTLALEIAIKLEISQVALQLGRKAVENYTGIESAYIDESSEAARLGVIACAKFGDTTDLERLAPLLSKQIVVHIGITDEQKTTAGQLRDLVLAYSAYLAGVDAKELGFPHLQENMETIFVPNSLTFDDEEQRQAAHEAWKRVRAGLRKVAGAARSVSG